MSAPGRLRPATPEDLPFIMATERLPGHAPRVGSFARAEHLRRMALPATRYMVFEAEGEALGFAVLRHDEDGMGTVQLHRLAVARPNRGHGRQFLRALCAEVFASPQTGRFWLDVLADNAAARHLYAGAGFVEEGVMRGALRLPDGGRRDLVLMAMLRADHAPEAGDRIGARAVTSAVQPDRAPSG